MIAVADAYLESRVMTSSAERLHLMVVEAALRFAQQGEEALAERKFDRSHEALNRSRACVNELVMSIQPEQNPELAERLKALFLYVHRNLMLADLEHDPQKIRDAVRLLSMHRETWLELIERLQTERPVAAAAVGVTASGYDRDEGSSMSWES